MVSESNVIIYFLTLDSKGVMVWIGFECQFGWLSCFVRLYIKQKPKIVIVDLFTSFFTSKDHLELPQKVLT